MPDKSVIKVEGIVEEALPGLLFRVKTDDGKELLAHMAGKMKLYRIRVVPGDRVSIEMPPGEERRGRITRRL
jgi:translation initiation factor IF-1